MKRRNEVKNVEKYFGNSASYKNNNISNVNHIDYSIYCCVNFCISND